VEVPVQEVTETPGGIACLSQPPGNRPPTPSTSVSLAYRWPLAPIPCLYVPQSCSFGLPLCRIWQTDPHQFQRPDQIRRC
jgi:hypothetical protein